MVMLGPLGAEPDDTTSEDEEQQQLREEDAREQQLREAAAATRGGKDYIPCDIYGRSEDDRLKDKIEEDRFNSGANDVDELEFKQMYDTERKLLLAGKAEVVQLLLAKTETSESAVIVSILDIFVLSPTIFPYEFISPNTVILFMLVILVAVSPTISPCALISPTEVRIPLMVVLRVEALPYVLSEDLNVLIPEGHTKLVVVFRFVKLPVVPYIRLDVMLYIFPILVEEASPTIPPSTYILPLAVIFPEAVRPIVYILVGLVAVPKLSELPNVPISLVPLKLRFP
jgi:hypothetical protein